MEKYKGSCHCGKVQYEAEVDLNSVIDCNCSMCSRKGTILAFATPDQFKLISGKDDLTDYLFYKKLIHHNFCKHCGVTSFAGGTSPEGKFMYAVNVRCLEGVDISKLNITHVDGKSF